MFEIPTFLSDLLKPGVLFPEEYFKYFQHIPTFIWGLCAALIITPIIGKIANQIGATYKPHAKQKGREFDNAAKAIHDVETPSLGGLSVTIPLFAFVYITFGWNSISAPFLIALGIMVVGALLDDIIVLPAVPQMLFQIIAATVIAFSVINISTITNPFGGEINLHWASWMGNFAGIPWEFVFPGDLILIGWILVCNISVKVVGGSPALIESNSFIAFILLFILGVRTYSDFVTINSLFVAGSLLGLIYFAFPPQKIMSGASGKSVYGFLIAVFAIINGAKFASTLLIIMMPIIDFTFVLIKRMITHKEYNFFKLMRISDTNHLHHQLIGLGLSRRQVLMIESSITLLIGSIAVFSTGAFKFFFLIFAAFLLITGIISINLLKQRLEKKREKEKDVESPESKYSY